MGRRILLCCGVLSPLLYALADALAGMHAVSRNQRAHLLVRVSAVVHSAGVQTARRAGWRARAAVKRMRVKLA
jgi:hypothetical protein